MVDLPAPDRPVSHTTAQMQHDSGVFADAVEQDRPGGLRDHLAKDVNALGFQTLQMRQRNDGLGRQVASVCWNAATHQAHLRTE
jgi:uncharacterized protein YidB (DUF937 family)